MTSCRYLHITCAGMLLALFLSIPNSGQACSGAPGSGSGSSDCEYISGALYCPPDDDADTASVNSASRSLSAVNWNSPMTASSGGTLPSSGGSAEGDVILSLGDDSIGDEFFGGFALVVQNLEGGEEIFVEKYLIPDGGSEIDDDSILVQAFGLRDEEANAVSGTINRNIPFDDAGEPGLIFTDLNFYDRSISQIVGDYVYRVSSPVGRFEPQTAPFTVTSETSYGQAFEGRVTVDGTGVAHPVVALMSTAGHILGFRFGQVADEDGYYRIDAPAGDYWPVAIKPGYLGRRSLVDATSLEEGEDVTLDLPLVEADRMIRGTLRDAANPARGLPGVRLVVRDDDDTFTLGFTDAGGHFEIGVTDGDWIVEVLPESIRHLGYLAPGQARRIAVDGTDVADIDIALRKGTALFSGEVRQEVDGAGFAAQKVRATNLVTGESSIGISEFGGGYQVAVDSGFWFVQVDYDGVAGDFLGRHGREVFAFAGRIVPLDFDLALPLSHIDGVVLNNADEPVPGVRITGFDRSGNYSTALTGADGSFSLEASEGDWMVRMDALTETYPFQQSRWNLQVEALESYPSLVEFRALEPADFVTIETLDVEGNAVEGIPVALLRHDEAAHDGLIVRGYSDDDGIVSLPVAEGEWFVRVGELTLRNEGYRALEDTVVTYPGADGIRTVYLEPMDLGRIDPVRGEGGEIHLNLKQAEPETNYLLQASDDLRDWFELGEFMTDAEGGAAVSVSTGDSDKQFYRKVRLP